MAIDKKPWQWFLSNMADMLSGVLPIVGKGRVGYMKVGEGEVQ